MNKKQKTIARRKAKASKIKKDFRLRHNTEKYKPNKYEERKMYDPETEKTTNEMVKVNVGSSMQQPESKKFRKTKQS